MQQIPLAIGPQPLATFDSFLAQRNEAVVEHLQQLGESAAPVYLWGPAGSGKTHLMRALAHRLQLQGRGVGWFDGSDPVPWTAVPGWALVFVDACDRLDAVAQAAAFTLFVETSAMGALWVAAGRMPPVDLPLRDDLRTRLAWGHVFAVHPLVEAKTPQGPALSGALRPVCRPRASRCGGPADPRAATRSGRGRGAIGSRKAARLATPHRTSSAV